MNKKPWSRMRELGRELMGRNDQILLNHLVGQLDATAEGLNLAREVSGGAIAPSLAREKMVEIEHRGDEERRALIVELSTALAPPIDREDMFRVSRSVDDVLDNLRDLVSEMDLFEIKREPLLDDLLAGVANGLTALRTGVMELEEQPERTRVEAQQAKKNEIRPRYQEAVADLLSENGPVSGLMMKRRELLRRVDVVGLRLGEAADALADGSIKRSR